VAAALASSPVELLRRAERIAGALGEHGATAARSMAVVGGGGAPGVQLDSAAVAVPAEFALPLRSLDPAVVGHVERGRLMLDLIAVPADLDDAVVEAVRQVAKDGWPATIVRRSAGRVLSGHRGGPMRHDLAERCLRRRGRPVADVDDVRQAAAAFAEG
jgi:L-seryl-tRNA(Ser) seleniumtransferase